MSISEDAFRAMVREAVARRLGPEDPASRDERPLGFSAHSSHFRYTLPGSDGPCLIEPTVRCNHCGYCESHGH